MSTGRDFDRIVGDWLEVGPTQLSDRVTEAARSVSTGRRSGVPSAGCSG